MVQHEEHEAMKRMIDIAETTAPLCRQVEETTLKGILDHLRNAQKVEVSYHRDHGKMTEQALESTLAHITLAIRELEQILSGEKRSNVGEQAEAGRIEGIRRLVR